MTTIEAKKRSEDTTRDAMQSEGKIPAVIYGFNVPSTSIAVGLIDFKKVWRDAGETGTISVATDAGTFDALIHEVQVNPVTDEPIHVDFLAIDTSKPVEVDIPVEFVGESPAVKQGIGSLVKVLHEVRVSGLPKSLPHSLVADITKLVTLEDQIVTGDLELPAGITLIDGAEEVVAIVEKEKEEVIEDTPIDLSAIEVEKKGKKEDAEGEEAAA